MDDVAAADSGREHQLVFRLPDPRLLRIISRTILITTAVISFPWIRPALLAKSPSPLKTEVARSGWFAISYTLPALLNDLQKQRFLRDGDRSIFLRDHTEDLTLLRQYQVDPRPKHRQWSVCDHFVDFLLAPEGLNDEESYNFVERVLLVGGLAVVRLGCNNFFVPSNYRVAYVRKFGSTFIVIKKMSHSPADDEIASLLHHRLIGRRQLLVVSAGRRAALEGLEDALFEPPTEAVHAVPVRYLRLFTWLRLFTCSVELAGMSFAGEPTKTKKQAEKIVVMAAWSALKSMPNLGPPASHQKEPESSDEQEQAAVARVLSAVHQAMKRFQQQAQR